VLRSFLLDVQARFKKLAPAYFREHQDARRPCATCAFNPATNKMRGWVATAAGLARVCDGRTASFRCHTGEPKRGEQYLPATYECAGMQVVRQDPTLHDAFTLACIKECGR
jgi:hypothetical protein